MESLLLQLWTLTILCSRKIHTPRFLEISPLLVLSLDNFCVVFVYELLEIESNDLDHNPFRKLSVPSIRGNLHHPSDILVSWIYCILLHCVFSIVKTVPIIPKNVWGKVRLQYSCNRRMCDVGLSQIFCEGQITSVLDRVVLCISVQLTYTEWAFLLSLPSCWFAV